MNTILKIQIHTMYYTELETDINYFQNSAVQLDEQLVH